MIKRLFFVIITLLVFSLFFQANIFAVPRSKKFKHADRNKDGVVDKKERRMENEWEMKKKRKESNWRKKHYRVNTAVEDKYDANSDGWLQPDEVRELLEDKYTLIQTKGKAKVDNQIEEEYDTNNDDIIDRIEAEAMRKDLID